MEQPLAARSGRHSQQAVQRTAQLSVVGTHVFILVQCTFCRQFGMLVIAGTHGSQLFADTDHQDARRFGSLSVTDAHIQ